MTKSLTNPGGSPISGPEMGIIGEEMMKQLNIRDVGDVYGVEEAGRRGPSQEIDDCAKRGLEAMGWI